MKPIMVERAKARQLSTLVQNAAVSQISDERKPIRTDEAVTRARAREVNLVNQINDRHMSCRARAREGPALVINEDGKMSCRARAREVINSLKRINGDAVTRARAREVTP